MSLQNREGPAAAHIAALVADRRDATGLVLLPDDISPVGDNIVAGFRSDAQALRVAALKRGITVDIAMPAGAQAGHYSEHAADWVLPLLLGVPGSVVATLVATYLQRRLDSWRSGGTSRMPTVRYREIVAQTDDTPARLREIEGPVDEVLLWLREERGAVPEIGEGDEDG